MGKKIDMIGRRYGRLIVESEVGRSGSGSIRYLCKCDCGKENRIDNDGNYCPSNCRWATAKEQARNKRTTHKIRYKDKYICLTDAAELSGIKFATLKRRLDLGWTQDRLFEPVHTEYSHSDEIRKAIQKTRIEG